MIYHLLFDSMNLADIHSDLFLETQKSISQKPTIYTEHKHTHTNDFTSAEASIRRIYIFRYKFLSLIFTTIHYREKTN